MQPCTLEGLHAGYAAQREIHVLVKVEVLAVSLIPEGLQHGHNGVPS